MFRVIAAAFHMAAIDQDFEFSPEVLSWPLTPPATRVPPSPRSRGLCTVIDHRTGLAPIILWAAILALAIGFADHASALLAVIPIGAVGAPLIMAGADLAISRRLFDGKPSCWWVIGVTALATVTVNPALGLVVGSISEFIQAAIFRRLVPQRPEP
jgi:hypothetical protein